MAVSPVGGQIYVNQATPAASQLTQTVFQRFDMQAFVAAELEREKEPQIEPVGDSDGSQGINANADGHNQEQYEEQKREKKEEEEVEEEPPHKSDHLLDLKV
jgi:hypothetical protein